jgi:hypothetical protein
MYVDQLLQHSQTTDQQNWIPNFVSLMALNNTLDGMESEGIFNRYINVMPWIYTQTQSPQLRIQSISASLLAHLA